MNALLKINYNTAWGENIVLVAGKNIYPASYAGTGNWELRLTGRQLHYGSEYRYAVERDGVFVREEWLPHVFTPAGRPESVIVQDAWLERPVNSAFFSQAFSEVIFRREGGVSFRHPRVPKAPGKGNVTIRIAAPEIRSREKVVVLGSWDGWKKPIPLDDGRFPFWEVTMDLAKCEEFKFAVEENGALVMWENGGNPRMDPPAKGESLIVADMNVSFPTRPWRGAGVAVPVFSLRTEDSFGIGEFNDIRRLAEWAVEAGQSFIQLLPINDCTMTRTWTDSYPYNAVSSFALNPIFVHLPAAGVPVDAAYKKLKDALESLSAVDYDRVVAEKERMMRAAFAAVDVDSAEIKEFVKANESWILPYAVFSAVRDEKGTSDFSTWGDFSVYSASAVSKYAVAHKDKVNYYIWVQYQLDRQLRDAVAYAHSLGVAIKGDLPIGVSRQSVDAWQNPRLFHMDSQAGAPPDAFSADGQNWGFPTYNWEEMAKDGYAWWKARMRKMSEYFDAYRIDHILGFFRIWEIPSKYKSGLMGHFSPALPYTREELGAFPVPGGEGQDVLFVEDPVRPGMWHPRISAQNTDAYNRLPDHLKDAFNNLYNDFFYRRHNEFWKNEALRKLPSLVESTGMLTCGEDLGMIPDCVPSVMSALGILSLEIQRMPKDPKDEFARPENYPYWCVCATGTHDTSPLRAWWEEDRGASARFYHDILHEGGEAPYFMEPWLAEKILRQHSASPAMLAILPLQDWLAVDGEVRYGGNPADERINIPAIPRHYWRYRMHLKIEDLLANKSLSAHLRGIVEDGGRNI